MSRAALLLLFVLPGIRFECFIIFIILIVELCFGYLVRPCCYFNNGSLNTQNTNSVWPVILIILAHNVEITFLFLFLSIQRYVRTHFVIFINVDVASDPNKAFAVPTFINPLNTRA